MSYALDLTEVQPQGHAARSCLIGRLSEELRLSADERSDLFYAILMKDAGCSSNAADPAYDVFVALDGDRGGTNCKPPGLVVLISSEIWAARCWRHPQAERTMLRLKPRQRAVIVEKLPDLANLAAGVLVLGQFVGEEPASVWRMILGAALWTGLAGVTLLIAGGES